jgi:hypothetical protein
MNDPSRQTSVLARLVTDISTAHRLFDALVEAFEAGGTAVAACEERSGAWTVEIYFAHGAPDQDAVRTLVGDLAGSAAGGRLRDRRARHRGSAGEPAAGGCQRH